VLIYEFTFQSVLFFPVSPQTKKLAQALSVDPEQSILWAAACAKHADSGIPDPR
jgi:hypothetical protein